MQYKISIYTFSKLTGWGVVFVEGMDLTKIFYRSSLNLVVFAEIVYC